MARQDDAGQKIVLLFFPPNPAGELVEQLGRYQAKASDFAGQEARLIGISNGDLPTLEKLIEETGLEFPILSDASPPGLIGAKYGLASDDQALGPAVFIIDEDGLIRRVYEALQYPHLPNPAMVVRALKKLAGLPKPPPITPDDWQLGPPEAPITVLEYADYQCPPCGEAYRLLKQIIPGYGDRILWVHRHLPLRHSHPLAQQAAEAAEAAGAQGQFWAMHDRLFEARLALEREQLIEYAGEIGLKVDQFTEDLDHRRFKDEVNADFKQAVRHKIKLPPALFINGLPLDGPRTEAAIRSQIDKLLACIAG
jgi:protein-disulfide isomerase/peroxiredoxin